MVPLPWTRLRSWFCSACGKCCRDYTPILTPVEGIKLSRKFRGAIEACIRGYIIRKGFDRRCVFQYRSGQRWLCGIQDTKPGACRLWPFKVCREPTYGRPEEAIFTCAHGDLYVYVDPECSGIVYGVPSREFTYEIIPEFIEVGLGGSNRQLYSTSRSPPHRADPDSSHTWLKCNPAIAHQSGLRANGRLAIPQLDGR